MKVTFTLKDLTDAFYNGFGSSIVGLLNMPDNEKFAYLSRKAKEKELKISMKIASGQFRDAVELNQLLRKDNLSYSFKIEPRKGYKLVTFEIK